MKPGFLVRSAVSSFIAMAALVLPAERAQGQQTPLVARYMGTLEKTGERQYAQPAATQGVPTANVMMFNPAQVGVSASSAETLTATFAVSGYSGSFTPTAILHHGLSYTVGDVSCKPNGASETCTVPVKFVPVYPGGRKDAIFLMDGTTRLATVLLGGIGEAPFALTQGMSTPVSSTPFPGIYIYHSQTDEEGTLYVLAGDTISTVTKAGVTGQISLTGNPHVYSFALDGAGVLYISANSGNSLITYDTVQGVQGTIPLPSADYWYPVVTGLSGSYYVLNQDTQDIHEFKPDGTTATTHVTPSVNQDYQMTIDAAADVFIGGYTINEITAGGAQSQVNTVGATDDLDVDAADTVYATRYNPTGGVAMLPASDYSTPIGSVDGTTSPLGVSVGPDGTVNVSNYTTLDVIDRSHSQTVIDFGEIDAGHTSQAKAGAIYNGGNQPLTISDFSTDNNDFSLESGKTGDCAPGVDLAPGAVCQIVATFSPTHPGSFSTTITIKSNSLNASNSISTIKVSGTSYGIYDVPSPSTLDFGSQAIGSSPPGAVTLTNDGYFYSSTIYSLNSDNAVFVPGKGTCTAEVAVGSSCQLSVTFSPTAVQTYSGTITVVAYVAGVGLNQTFTFAVTGKGKVADKAATPVITPPTGTYHSSQSVSITDSTPGAKIYYTTDGSLPTTLSTLYNGPFTVSKSGTTVQAVAAATSYSNSDPATATYTIILTPGVSFSPSSLNFSSQYAGTTSAKQSTTLTNTGNGALTFSGITISGANPSDFAQTNNCGASLAVGGSCSISVTFTPASVSSFSATLSVTDNASSSPQTVTLTGTGTTPPAPVASLTPASLSFTAVSGTTATAQGVTLKNSGNAALTISGIAIGGANPGDFAQTNTCGASLAVGGSCSISVTFTPASAASFTATLSMTDDAGGSPQVVTLSGTGTSAPSFTLSSSAASGSVQPSGTAKFNITVSAQNGTYSSPVTFSVSGLPTGASAAFQPLSVTPGSSSATSVLTIQASASTALSTQSGSPWPLSAPALALVGFLFVPRRVRKRWTSLAVLLFASLGALAALSGCGGGFAMSSPKTYTITVTGTSGADKSATTIQLTVQ